jgi:U3 small nucleolar RNA-associated protein 25
MLQVSANHTVSRKQQVIMKTNATIAKSDGDVEAPAESLQDQGFTRPSTLILVPFRNSALRWMTTYIDLLTESGSVKSNQVQNMDRFVAEYSLSEGTLDKLAEAEDLGIYPPDHVQTFKGNIDDNFKIGLKVLKRGAKVYEPLITSDVIIASPLGLRLAIERDE